MLQAMADEGGALWALCLLGSAALLGVAAVRAPWSRTAPHWGSALTGVGGMVVLMVGFFTLVSPDVRTDEGPAIARFSARVNQERRPGDELRTFEVSVPAIEFLTGQLTSPMTSAEVSFRCRDPRPGRRLLLISSTSGAQDLRERWGNRLGICVREPFGRHRKNEMILMELIPAK